MICLAVPWIFQQLSECLDARALQFGCMSFREECRTEFSLSPSPPFPVKHIPWAAAIPVQVLHHPPKGLWLWVDPAWSSPFSAPFFLIQKLGRIKVISFLFLLVRPCFPGDTSVSSDSVGLSLCHSPAHQALCDLQLWAARFLQESAGRTGIGQPPASCPCHQTGTDLSFCPCPQRLLSGSFFSLANSESQHISALPP